MPSGLQDQDHQEELYLGRTSPLSLQKHHIFGNVTSVITQFGTGFQASVLYSCRHTTGPVTIYTAMPRFCVQKSKQIQYEDMNRAES